MRDRRRFLGSFTASAAAGAVLNYSTAAAAPMDADTTTFRDHVLRGLGGDWPEPCPLEPRIDRTEQRDGYRLEWLDYAVESGDRVPAVLLVPDGVSSQSPAPGICVWHQHNGEWHLGKSEPAGLAGNPMHHTGVALARLGYVVLCPDAL
ncbi:MAG: hypothetical protein KDA75_18560, partial [Planctomycetaceae bacterium]|nr:hypothetical protein [Planctomycetaceae bacterium]